jgi:hypothetical protein
MKLTGITLLLTLLLTGCGPDAPLTSTDQIGVDTTQLNHSDTVVQDQIEHTRESSPAAPEKQAPRTKVSAPDQVNIARPQPVPPPPPTNTAPARPAQNVSYVKPSGNAPSHDAFDALLREYVSSNGKVNYAGFKANEKKLDAYLNTLARQRPQSDWSREQKLAYWINVYNAFTIKLIVDHYPVESIKDIDRPWDKKWIELDGKTFSLNEIEHDIIRPTFREPRIHFALVCAAISCPPLADRAYTAENLEQMLQQRTRQFINNERFNVTQEEVVRISPLFDWYADDFGDVTDYLNKYLSTDIPKGKELHYLDYDWGLND